jgi:hypothetical protein
VAIDKRRRAIGASAPGDRPPIVVAASRSRAAEGVVPRRARSVRRWHWVRRMRNRVMILFVMMTAAAGCLGAVAGNNNDDGGAGGGGGGGTARVYFDPDVQTAMDALGCSASDCHGDPTTPMHVIALANGGHAGDNYGEVVPRTQGGATSLLLSKPVDGNMLAHDGGKLFAPSSTTYRQWKAWIDAGAPLHAPGAATPPAQPDMSGATMTPPLAGDMGPCLAVKPTTMSSHNAGQDCLSCHATNPDLTLRFTLAGTLFMDSFGTTPRGGATVTVTDAKGLIVPLISDVEGNFYTIKALTFPVTVAASACPSSMAMVGKPANGACNASGCHDAKQPAYLP